MSYKTLEEKYLIEELLLNAEGIGKKLAQRIVDQIPKVGEFDEIDTTELNNIKGVGPVLASNIQKRIDNLNLDFSKSIQEIAVKTIVYDYLENQYQRLNRYGYDSLNLNTLLFCALGVEKPLQFLKFSFYHFVTISTSTSWGQKPLEKICLYLGASKIPDSDNVTVSGKRFDIKRETGTKTYYIQLKAGSNTMNIGMVSSLNDMIEKIEDRHENVKGILGMSDGNKSDVSTQIKDNLNEFDDRAYIGKEFWELISGDPDMYSKVIYWISSISEQFSAKFEDDYFALISDKLGQIIEDWEERYGDIESGSMASYVDELVSPE